MTRSLSSQQLDAFLTVAQEKNFSKAAKKLFVTQSALSQRISKLEQRLGLTLIIRDSKTVKLTAMGSQLLRYCLAREKLEAEFLADLQFDSQDELTGSIRIAGFSSITQSILLPALAKFKQQPYTNLNKDLSVFSLILA